MKPRAAAAFLLGAVTVLGFAPFKLFPLPLATLAVLFHFWRTAFSPRHAALLGGLFGCGFFLAGVSWIYVSLSEFGGMAMPLAAFATVIFCAAMALYPALAGYVFARWRGGGDWRDVALAAGAWTLTDWLRGWVLTGFPWLALGTSQSPPSPLAGFVPLVGSHGVGLIVALLAAALAFVPRRLAFGAVAATLLVGALLRGVAWTEPVGAPTRIALLQGNIPQSLKWDPRRLSLSLDAYADLARRHPADLTVLPETAIPLFFDQVPREVFVDLTRHGATLLGIAVRTRDGGYTNGAVAVTRRSDTRTAEGIGFDVEAYAKRHLVPFGEYAPPGFAWFFSLAHIPMSDFSAGPTHQAPLAIAGQRIAPNICYEDAFGEELLSALPAATLFINLSNTAWFGNSLAQPQHLQIAQLRALETGRPMLRATNTGMTALVLPDGTVAATLEPFARDALTVEVTGYTGLTPFARHGNTGAVLLALACCVPAWRRRRTGQDAP